MSDQLDLLANSIAKSVISHFHSPNLKGRPTIRSNGIKEWTVLAGIVSLHQVNGPQPEIKTISIATGVKALPDATIKSHSRGLLLHDCHAEVLSLRGFNWFVIQECLKMKNGEESLYFEIVEKRFRLKPGIDFAMYVSEPPCGDASLEQLVEEGDKEWDTHTELSNGVLRGRENFTITGKVRTKPGRRDSPLTLSKSCSDKLTLKQFTSILNGVTSSYVDPKGMYLKYLVLPEAKAEIPAVERCFYERFQPLSIKNGYGLHSLVFLTTVENHDFVKEHPKQQPSNTSLIYIPEYQFNESIVNSVKEGYYTKRKAVRKHGESEVSRFQLFQASKSLIPENDSKSYVEWKLTNIDYVKAKEIAQRAIGGWCSTSIDDFDT